jgi:LPS export ABC transporter protein LptC
LIISIVTGCSQDKSDIINNENDKEYPIQEGWKSKLQITRAGRLQTIVRYGHMAKYENKKGMFFDEGIIVDFFNENQEHTSQLTSDRGVYYEDTENVAGMGNVVVISDTGMTLRTETLRYDSYYEKILSDTVVMVTTPQQDTLYGLGFESKPDLSRWIIRKPWGISEKRIEIEEFRESFSRSSPENK